LTILCKIGHLALYSNEGSGGVRLNGLNNLIAALSEYAFASISLLVAICRVKEAKQASLKLTAFNFKQLISKYLH